MGMELEEEESIIIDLDKGTIGGKTIAKNFKRHFDKVRETLER